MLNPQRPMAWDEVLLAAQRPSLQVALSAAKMGLNAPPALIALLQEHMVIEDLSDMRAVLAPKLDELALG